MCTTWGARAIFVYMLLRTAVDHLARPPFALRHSPGARARVLAKYPAEQCRVHHSALHFAENQGGGEREYEIQIADGKRNFASLGIYIPLSQTEIIKFTLLDSPQCEI